LSDAIKIAGGSIPHPNVFEENDYWRTAILNEQR
jgi:hypothetical protein